MPLVIILLLVLGIAAVGGGYVIYKDKAQIEDKDTVAEPVGIKTEAKKTDSTNKGGIFVIFPEEGSVLTEGKTYTITWGDPSSFPKAYNLYLENDKVGSIRIGETSESSFTWVVPDLAQYANSGDYVHTIPEDGYRISIGTGSTLKDLKQYYSSYFKIISPTTHSLELSLSTQAGLPAAVEAKRQAIYKAAVAHDLNKLKKEATSRFFDDGFGLGVDPWKQQIKGDQNNFDIITTLLKMPYIIDPSDHNEYIWPSFFFKESKDWTAEDVNNMKTILSDKEIEDYRKSGEYTYYRIAISPSGEWTLYYTGTGD